ETDTEFETETESESEEELEENAAVKAANADEYSTDLKDYITELKLYKIEDGVPTEIDESTEIYDGDEVQVTYKWTIPGEAYKVNKNYTYKLPYTFKVTQSYSDYIKQGNQNVGTFTVNTDGTVNLTYYDSYNTENNQTIDSMGVKGVARYKENADEDDGRFNYKDDHETLVVLGKGDFDIKKEAAKVYENGTLADKSMIEYTVTIQSNNGTQGEFEIEDALTLSGDFASVTFDEASFKIVDNDGAEITGWSNQINGTSFKMEHVPRLPQGKTYKLIYRVNVEQKEGMNAQEIVKNKVTVKNPEFEKTDTKTITYKRKIWKEFRSYDRNRGMQWRVYVDNSDNAATGLTITDTAEAPIVRDAIIPGSGNRRGIVVFTVDSGGNYVRVDNLGEGVTLSNDDKTFTYTFPSRPNAVRYAIDYYTKVEFPEGATELVVNNTAAIKNITTDDEWTATAQGIGQNDGSATVTKNGKGYDDSDDMATYHWDFEVEYTNLNRKEVEVRDHIGNANLLRGRAWDTPEYTAYAGMHYGIAKDIDADIRSNLRLVITDEDGNEEELTYQEAIARGYKIRQEYYSVINATSEAYKIPADNNGSKRVKDFRIFISNADGTPLQNLKKVRLTDYRTVFNKQYDNAGYRWKMFNTVYSLSIGDEEIQTYESTYPELQKYVQLVNSSNRSYWTTDPQTQDYEKLGGVLRYRIIATVPEGQTKITIQDQLPKGMGLVGSAAAPYWNDYFIIGPANDEIFRAQNDRSTLSWTDAKRADQISVNIDENNLMTVEIDLKNLYLSGNRRVGIEYLAYMTPYMEKLDGAVTTEKDGVYTTHHTFVNTATYGDLESTVSVPIEHEKYVLSKAGSQVKDEAGNLTSTVHYQVLINPFKLDLINPGNKITVTDNITSTNLEFELDRDSIRLSTIEEGKDAEDYQLGNAEIVSVPESEFKIHFENPKVTDTGYEQKFKMEVDDGQIYLLEYDYKVLGAKSGNSGKLSNTVEVEGVAKTSTEDEVTGISAWATSDNGALRLYKVDADNNLKHLSATFDLEKYDAATDSFSVVEENFNITDTAAKVYEYFRAGCLLEGNTLYRIVEKETQEGYMISKDATYFIIRGNVEDVRNSGIIARLVISTENEAKTAAYGNKTVLNAAGESVSVDNIEINMLAPNRSMVIDIENEKIPEKELLLKKVWEDNDDVNRPDSVSFQVYQTGGSNEEAEPFGDPIVLKKDEKWSSKITVPECDKYGTPYEYYVTEINEKNGNITIGRNTYQVTYDVSSEEDVITVTNRRIQAIDVPQTGSNTRWYFMIFGCLLMAAGAMLSLAGRRRIHK
ncbi:MAG: hypothetical protein Q4B01_09895, partial [Eubacteriales bacterium]|nr:hypothetical protein [Eubacteriales bacterium]